MQWREALRPVTMQRVALLAPADTLRDLLVVVADEGCVDLDDPREGEPAGTPEPATAALQRVDGGSAVTAKVAGKADLSQWEIDGRVDLIAGEAQLESHASRALTKGRVAALTGWAPADTLPPLAERAAAVGGSVVALPAPRGVDPPTLLSQEGVAREFAPLVETYATVPYRDVNPSVIAGVAYLAMFGIMFADAGQGILLLLAALAVRTARWKRLARLRPYWLYLAGAGLASAVFGALYGEFFGPTHAIPVVWLAPLDHPVTLLSAAVAVGALLLAGSYALGTVNRFREGGWRRAIYAPSGLAGSSLFLGLGAVSGGIYLHLVWLAVAGGVVAATGLVVGYAGLLAAAGGGVAGASQAAIEMFDLVIRLGSNLFSFARLAAFGLTHAALGQVVWQGTTGLVHHGPLGIVGGAVIFTVGNTFTFALEGLVAAIQALRLEYYELFSRIFDGEGRPFHPWHVPMTEA